MRNKLFTPFITVLLVSINVFDFHLILQVLDAGGVPIPEPKGGNNSPGVETTQPHRVLIASEEQFKMFALPTLKPCGKYKLTAHEGSRVRKVGFVTFPSKVGRKFFHIFTTYILLMACWQDWDIFANMSLLRMLITDVSGITFRKNR